MSSKVSGTKNNGYLPHKMAHLLEVKEMCALISSSLFWLLFYSRQVSHPRLERLVCIFQLWSLLFSKNHILFTTIKNNIYIYIATIIFVQGLK